MSSANPLVLVLLPSIYLLGATFSLLQFSVLLTTITKGVAEIKRLSQTYAFLKHALPFLTSSKDFLNKVFGEGQKFVPQPTHVILVALMLCFIVHIERLRK